MFSRNYYVIPHALQCSIFVLWFKSLNEHLHMLSVT